VPGKDVKRGDVYLVHRSATVEGDDVRDAHPMVCVAEQPMDPAAWKGMARVSTGGRPEDLPSPQQPDLPFTKDGYWTYRYIRSVKKSLTGHPSLCPFKVALPEPPRDQVLDHYKNRPRPRTTTAPTAS
jgi:hypothetical protein